MCSLVRLKILPHLKYIKKVLVTVFIACKLYTVVTLNFKASVFNTFIIIPHCH